VRHLEYRRHTMRVKPGAHLSAEGVARARRVGAGRGPFAYVVSSNLPRAYETAIAMGFAVDEMIEALGTTTARIDAIIPWPASFAQYAAAVAAHQAVSDYAARQAELLRGVLAHVPEGGAALVVSHGGVVELGVIGALPGVDYATFGAHLDYCEGVVLSADEAGHFTQAEVLRV
jgi:broad specificity phosphatase PhoE